MDNKYIVLIIAIVIVLVGAGVYLYANSSDPDTVNIGYLPSDHHAALLIAETEKKYESKGVKVNLVKFDNGGNLMTAMANGEVDVGYVGITPALSSISKGVPVKIVSSVQEEGSGIVVPDDSSISNVSDLKDKKVATPDPSSIQYMLLLYALKEANLDKNDLTISSLKSPQLVDAIKTKKLDGIVAFEPFVTQAVLNANGTEIASSNDILPEHPCCVIVAREDFITNHEDKLKTILDIHNETTEYILKNPEEAATKLPADQFDVNVEKVAMKNIKFTSGLSDDYKNKVKDFMNIEIDLGLIEKALDINKIFQTI